LNVDVFNFHFLNILATVLATFINIWLILFSKFMSRCRQTAMKRHYAFLLFPRGGDDKPFLSFIVDKSFLFRSTSLSACPQNWGRGPVL
jgi:hypothetical protein